MYPCSISKSKIEIWVGVQKQSPRNRWLVTIFWGDSGLMMKAKYGDSPPVFVLNMAIAGKSSNQDVVSIQRNVAVMICTYIKYKYDICHTHI